MGGRSKYFANTARYREAKTHLPFQRNTDFWHKVRKPVDPDGCWQWMGGHTTKGYGTAVWEGRHQYAHRLMFRLFFGLNPGRLFVCHHCDNPICVRPDHLFLGTCSDNALDMFAKGRNNPFTTKGVPHANQRKAA